MNAQTVGDAVATRSKAETLIRHYSEDFATVLPSHIKPATWVRLAQGALRRDANLQKAADRNSGSLLQALLDAARMGLEPGTEQFYLVPFGNEVTGVVGYQGEIEMMYRAGAISSIKAELVYEKDEFDFDPAMDRPHHKPDWFGERGDIIGAYAYAVMKDGATSRVVVMSRKDIEKVRAVSPSGKSSASPWNKWWDRMALKTVLHQLAKFVPTSAEYRREQLRAAVEADNLRRPSDGPAPVAVVPDPPTGEAVPAHDPETGEVVEAEIVHDDGDAPASPWDVAQQAGAEGTPITKAQQNKLHAALSDLGITERPDKLAYCSKFVGRDLSSSSDLTKDEARQLLDAIDADLAANFSEDAKS